MKDLFSQTIITGAGGIIGSYFDFGHRLDLKDLDITDEKIVERVFRRIKPKLVIHLAAATDVEKCEKEPEYAWRVNALGTFNVSKACRKYGAGIVYVSTAVVFGSNKPSHGEKDIPSPDSAYGRSKYAGELAVRDLVPDHLILRTSWVFGGGPERDHKFVGNIIRQIREGKKNLQVVGDLVCSATYAKDFVMILKKLLRENRRGIFHVVNSGSASRFEMAREIASALNSPVSIKKISGKDFGGMSSKLNPGTLKTSLPPLRSWKEALREYIKEEWNGTIFDI